MSLQITPLFQGRWQIFWATTYSFEPRIFEEFWLPRLGDPPLNVTILADFDRLTQTWSAMDSDEGWRLQRANRDYLVRGIHITNGAFHPKTYFFANKHDGLLLVGSGNLGLNGLEEGHEVFCQFDATATDGLSAIQAWGDWMDRLVKRLDDHLVTTRWLDVRSRVDWLRGATGRSHFVANWDRSLMNQILDAIPAPCEEMHVMAPFFDPQAHAVHRLIMSAQPRHVHVYVGRAASVQGEELVNVLRGCGAEVFVHSFIPAAFVHAKLIGIVSGGDGWLLSGSANLSLAALTQTVATGTGNVEAGVLVRTTSDVVRSAFVPTGLEAIDQPLESLATLRFIESNEPTPLPLALLSAARLPDRRVRVSYTGPSQSLVFLCASAGRKVPLHDQTTVEPFAMDDDVALVWLTDSDGNVLSNRVPLDDPARLSQCLLERSATADRPREIDEQDLQTPVGQMLERLHHACIFDVADTIAVQRAQATSEGGDDPTFWDRLVQEELRLDPRFHHYQHLGSKVLDEEDDIFALLRLMLARTPESAGLHSVRAESDDGDDDTKTGKPWSISRRLQVRLYNVLDRWARALSDPRHRWIDVLAPVRNYTALLAAIAECFAQAYLDRDRIIRLLGTLWSSFICTENVAGYLFALSDDERREAIAELAPSVASLGAAMAYIAVRPTVDWKPYLFAWQSFLVPALELKIMCASEDVTTWTGLLLDEPVPAEEVAKRLKWAASHIDDAQWCALAERDLGLSSVEFKVERAHGGYQATMQVVGVSQPLADARLVTIARKALDYRKAQGIILALPDGRISIQLDEPVFALIHSQEYESKQPLTHHLIDRLETAGAGWGALLSNIGESAS